jgi:hypothetical protein
LVIAQEEERTKECDTFHGGYALFMLSEGGEEASSGFIFPSLMQKH